MVVSVGRAEAFDLQTILSLQVQGTHLVELHNMQGISKNLVSRAFPSGPERPDYLISEEFLKFTPTEDFMSLPGEILRTEFRLVVTHEGWEYTVLERELGAHVDPLRKMLVTVRFAMLSARLSSHPYIYACWSECRTWALGQTSPVKRFF